MCPEKMNYLSDMYRYFLLAFLLLGMAACSDSPQHQIQQYDIAEEDLTEERIDSILMDYRFEYEDPILIDSSEMVLIPISTRQDGKRKRVKSYSSKYKSYDFPRYWNVLFYDRESGESRLLTQEKKRIYRIEANLKKLKVGERLAEKILYQIADTDFNGDGKLAADDPHQLFVSNLDGTDLKRLSAAKERLQGYKLIPGTDQLLFHTLRDVNGDLEFDRDDETIWYHAKLMDDNGDWSIKEMINAEGRKNIEHLYFEQWLQK